MGAKTALLAFADGDIAPALLFGFVPEGYPHPGDIDPFGVPMHGVPGHRPHR